MQPRTRVRTTTAIIVGVLMTGVIASPALARGDYSSSLKDARARSTAVGVRVTATVRRPDGRIRLQKYRNFQGTETYSYPWAGDNIYNTSAAHQKAKDTYYGTTPGVQTWTFGISIQNGGNPNDRFKVQATGPTASGWTIQFFRGTTNITSAVLAGTYQTQMLAAGAAQLITAKVAVEGGWGNVSRLVTLTSDADPTKKDAVKFVLKELGCGC